MLVSLKNSRQQDSHFASSIAKIHKRMSQLEAHKHLPPKVSNTFNELALHCAPFSAPSPGGSRDLLLDSPPKARNKRPSPFLPILDRQLGRIKEARPNKTITAKPKKRLQKKKPPARMFKDSTAYYESLIDKNLREDHFVNSSEYDDCYYDGLFFSKLQ